MTCITKQQKQPDIGLVYSIGKAVDLVEIDEAMREFAEQPWDLSSGTVQQPLS
jgi:hypothetical protein